MAGITLVITYEMKKEKNKMRILGRKKGKFLNEDGTYTEKNLLKVEGIGWVVEGSPQLRRLQFREKVLKERGER